MAEATSKAVPGAARAPGMTYQEAIQRDSSPPPAPFLEHSYEFTTDVDIPYTNYTSHEFAEAEFKKMWPKVWQMACREEHIPEPGDYHVYDIGDLSAVMACSSSSSSGPSVEVVPCASAVFRVVSTSRNVAEPSCSSRG